MFVSGAPKSATVPYFLGKPYSEIYAVGLAKFLKFVDGYGTEAIF
jgi:hypothetical protein